MKKQDLKQLPLSQAAFPVSPSPPPENGRALRMNATCGRKCAALLPNCGPVGCLGKMLLASSIWGSTKRSLTWQKRDTLFSHSYFRLAVSAHGMSASELLSSRLMFPTPLASDNNTARDAASLDVFLSDNGIFRKRNRNGAIWSLSLSAAVFYEALYQSALCRQKADWLVGINATRLFSVLYHRTLNVGRVQTPTLAMLAERDAKITLFHKEKYHLLRLTLDGIEAVSEKITDPAEAEQAAAMCKGAAVTCTAVTKEQKKEQPPKLYDLTTLQREANRLFGYTAKQTLDYSQSLYEKKLLTYPRTDSRYLTSDMVETASCVIHLAAKLPPFDGCTNFFPLVETMISDKDVSDHHAIIPTMEIEKADIKVLPLGERNLFLLVCCKLLCASAEPYMYEAVTATFDCGGHSFTAKGKCILSEGWREIDRIFRASLKEKPVDGDGGTFPDFTEGQTFDGAEVSVTEHFTQPPKPYTEDICCERGIRNHP